MLNTRKWFLKHFYKHNQTQKKKWFSSQPNCWKYLFSLLPFSPLCFSLMFFTPIKRSIRAGIHCFLSIGVRNIIFGWFEELLRKIFYQNEENRSRSRKASMKMRTEDNKDEYHLLAWHWIQKYIQLIHDWYIDLNSWLRLRSLTT